MLGTLTEALELIVKLTTSSVNEIGLLLLLYRDLECHSDPRCQNGTFQGKSFRYQRQIGWN